MDENYPVSVALLKISGRNEKPHVESCGKEDRGWYSKPRHHPARERIEIYRGGVLVDVHFYFSKVQAFEFCTLYFVLGSLLCFLA
jgi:hypothetical protein